MKKIYGACQNFSLFIAAILVCSLGYVAGCSSSSWNLEHDVLVELGLAPPVNVPVIDDPVMDPEDDPIDPDDPIIPDPGNCSNETASFVEGSDGTPGDGIFYVSSFKNPTATGTITVSETGYYQIFNVASESGPAQTNETGWITITNSMSEEPGGYHGYPVPEESQGIPNCGEYTFIVQDADNDPASPPPDNIYFGTFRLVAGEDNDLILYHYCPAYRENVCTEFHVAEPSATDCHASSGANSSNSIHFEVAGLCVTRLPD